MVNEVASWLAPIASTLIVCAGQLVLNASFKRVDEKRDAEKAETDAKRKAEAEWRESIDKRLNEQAETIIAILDNQCSQTRSDIVHKYHRYVDDLGCASVEEKDALRAEHKQYSAICEKYGIENDLIDDLVQQVMDLPTRKPIDTTSAA